MSHVRRALTVAVVVALAGGAAILFAGAGRAAERVDLPTEEDVFGLTVGAETILFGPKGIETLLPGPVDDEEVVTVDVGPGGVPAAVGVRQRLVVHGLGDYRFKVSGPAQTVEALPDSQAEPGLRKGAVLWQGFSAEQEVLSSEMLLFPDQEAIRLPLEVTYEQSPDWAGADEPFSGELSARIAIANRSASPVTVTSARGEPVEVARALDAIAARLGEGERPRPGENGVPRSLTASGPTKPLTRSIPATFRVTGRLTFEGGTVDDARAAGGRLTESTGGPPVVRFGGFVGAGNAGSFEVSLTGDARDLGRPVLQITARPAPPPAAAVRPPQGGTWTELAAVGELNDTRRVWNRIMKTAWGVAKLRQYDAYLGNPDPTGAASTEYRFRLAAPAPPPAPGDVVPAPATATPLLATTAILALLLLLFDGVLLWSLL